MEFSVLASVYFHENPVHLSAALASIVNQTLIPDEIVLMVDGPIPKELSDVIEKYQTLYPDLMKVIVLEENIGLGNALRIGVEKCSYELIARMDTDDICLPQRFEKQVAFLMSNEDIAVVGTNVEEFDAVPGDLKIYKKLPAGGPVLVRYAKYRNPLNHPTIMFRKQAVLAAGNYDGEIQLFEDYMLYVRMLMLGFKFYNLQEVLVFFRIGNRIANVKRRSGHHYFRNELRFLNYSKRLGYLKPFEFTKAVLTKPIIRLLPIPIVIWFYRVFLRKTN